MTSAKQERGTRKRLTASVAVAAALAITAATPALAQAADTDSQTSTDAEQATQETADTSNETAKTYTEEEAAAQNAKVDEERQTVADKNAEIAQENAEIDHGAEESEEAEENAETEEAEAGEATNEETAPENAEENAESGSEEADQDAADGSAENSDDAAAENAPENAPENVEENAAENAEKNSDETETAAKPNQTVVAENNATDAENNATDEANRALIEKNEEQEADPAEDLPEVPQAPVFEGVLPEMPAAPQIDDSMPTAEKNAALDAYSQQVEAYNALVAAYNQAVNAYNNAVDDGVRGDAAASYNAAVEAYNVAVEAINAQTKADNADTVTANNSTVADNETKAEADQAVAEANGKTDKDNQDIIKANALLDADGNEIGTQFTVTNADGTTTTVTLQLPIEPYASALETLPEDLTAALEEDYAAAVAAYNEAVKAYQTSVGNYGEAVASYNAAVDNYNQAVKAYNDAVATCNAAANAANQKANNANTTVQAPETEDEALAALAKAVNSSKAALDELKEKLAKQGTPTTDAEVDTYNELVAAYNAADEAYRTAVATYNAAIAAQNAASDEANRAVDTGNADTQNKNNADAAGNRQTIVNDLLAIANGSEQVESSSGTVETTSTTDASGTTTVTTQITQNDGATYRVVGTVQGQGDTVTLTAITVEVTTTDASGAATTQTYTLDLTTALGDTLQLAAELNPNDPDSYNKAVAEYIAELTPYNESVVAYQSFVTQYNAAIGQYQAVLNAADASLQTVNASTLAELETKLSGNAAKSFKYAAGQTYTHTDADGTTSVTFASADAAKTCHEGLTKEVNAAKAALVAAGEKITSGGMTEANIEAYNAAVRAYNQAVTNYNNFAVLCDAEKLTSSGTSVAETVDRPLYVAQTSSTADFYILFSGTVPFENGANSYGAQYYTDSVTTTNKNGTVSYTSNSTIHGTVTASTTYTDYLTFGTTATSNAKVTVENQYYARTETDSDGNTVNYYVDKAGARYTLNSDGYLCDADGKIVEYTNVGSQTVTVRYKTAGSGTTLYVTDTSGKYATGVSQTYVSVPESANIVKSNEWNTREFDFDSEEELEEYFENVNMAITTKPDRESMATMLEKNQFDDSIVQAYKDEQIDVLWYVAKSESGTIHVDGVLYWKDSLQVVGREQFSKLATLDELHSISGTSAGISGLNSLTATGKTVEATLAAQATVLQKARKQVASLGQMTGTLTEADLLSGLLLETIDPLQNTLRELQPAQMPSEERYVDATPEETTPDTTPDTTETSDETASTLTEEEKQLIQEIAVTVSNNLATAEADGTHIQEENTPLAGLTQKDGEAAEAGEAASHAEIEDAHTPLSGAPRTGDGIGLWGISALAALAGLLRKKKYQPRHSK